ncbi:MAG: cyclic nucleotide-binding domain-containing protein [Stellaceae bacterium]
MTTLSQFKKGDILFRQGDASDRVLRVRRGEIEVLREVGAASVLLGHVRDGEWLGEMGVIECRSRSATARAVADGEVEVLTARQFLERMSGDPTLACDLILRLSVRLRGIEDKIAGDLLPFAHDRSQDGMRETASDAVIARDATISLAAQSDALRARIGAVPIHVATLPFMVGRTPVEGEAKPSRRPDLMIEDEEPFRLSRQHFMIARSADRLLVSDLGSTLGTIVNGRAIGHHFMKDAAPLHSGENHIIAGGLDSPFEFLVSVGQEALSASR